MMPFMGVGGWDWLPTESVSLTDAACEYAGHGFRVLSVWGIAQDGQCACGRGCETPGKHPVAKGWQRLATSDPLVVRDARRGKLGSANIGLAMGPCDLGHLVAIDIDGPEGRESWQALTEGREPIVTLTSRSGRRNGGSHMVFVLAPHQDPARLTNSAGKRKGIDVRSRNGQIVVAPSMHASGNQYEWEARVPPATMPDWLFEAFASPLQLVNESYKPTPRPTTNADERYVEAAITNACEDIAAAGAGVRNNTLNRLSFVVLRYAAALGWSESRACEPLIAAGVASGLKGGVREATDVVKRAWESASAQPKAIPPLECRVQGPRSYVETLSLTQKGNVEKCMSNLLTILNYDERWTGKIVRDAFRDKTLVTSPTWSDAEGGATREAGARPWTESDDGRLQRWSKREFGVEFTKEQIMTAVDLAARRREVHPVRDYLRGCKWDGVPRVKKLWTRYLGATNDPLYLEAIAIRWMVSAVARVMEPGCKVDHTPILEGRQGIGKSTAIKILGGEWFSDTPLPIGHKDSFEQLQGNWIIEFGELDSVTRSEVTKVKAFLTATSDNYRAAYARRPVDVPRQVVFVGSTNEREYLKDPSGNRRFWPVACGEIDLAGLRADRDQLWAEAVHLYDAGQAWHVDSPQLAELCSAEQESRTASDAWSDVVGEWLSRPYNANSPITSKRVLIEALGFEAGRIDRGSEMRLSAVMRGLGWETQRTRIGERFGRQWRPVPTVPTCADLEKKVGTENSQMNLKASERVPTVPQENTKSLETEKSAHTQDFFRNDDHFLNVANFGGEVGTEAKNEVQTFNINDEFVVPTFGKKVGTENEVGTDSNGYPEEWDE